MIHQTQVSLHEMSFSVHEQHTVIDRLWPARGYFTISLDVKCSRDVEPLNKYTPGARFSSRRTRLLVAIFTVITLCPVMLVIVSSTFSSVTDEQSTSTKPSEGLGCTLNRISPDTPPTEVGQEFTVNAYVVLLVPHPLAAEYDIVAVPAATPDTTPIADTVATPVLELLHVPPVAVFDRVVVLPIQTLSVPVIVPASGIGLTVMLFVT